VKTCHERGNRERGIRRTSPATQMGEGGAETSRRRGGVIGRRWCSMKECYGRGWSELRTEMGAGKDEGGGVLLGTFYRAGAASWAVGEGKWL
jgi:hypothetical protein